MRVGINTSFMVPPDLVYI